MPTFEETIHSHFDARIDTLGKVKSRSIGADSLTLTALNVLIYAQLEGGVKDLTACVLRHINLRRLALGEIRPTLLKWRNPDEIERFRSALDFSMISSPSPFVNILSRHVKLKGINRRHELNQMGSAALKRIYVGLGLDYSAVSQSTAQIDELVDHRNSAAHYGILPSVATAIMEKQVRGNVMIVEKVLTDLSIQLLLYFVNRLHMR